MLTETSLLHPLAGMAITAQVAAPAFPTDFAAWKELTLVPFLLLVCWVLGKQYLKKDRELGETQQKLVAMAERVTETTTAALDAVKELRFTTERLESAIDKLAVRVSDIRCPADIRQDKR